MLKVPLSPPFTHTHTHTHIYTHTQRKETFRGDGYVYGISMVMMSWVYASNLSGCTIKNVQVFLYVNRVSV